MIRWSRPKFSLNVRISDNVFFILIKLDKSSIEATVQTNTADCNKITGPVTLSTGKSLEHAVNYGRFLIDNKL